MREQLDIFSGEELRDAGIALAEEAAERRIEGWSERAYEFFLSYARSHTQFMVEEVREAARGAVPEPSSKRAWGGIVMRAAKNHIIFRVGFRNVKNAHAHCTPASLWMKA